MDNLSHAPLTARKLTCRRGHRLLFKDLDLVLNAGDRVWLKGPNGAGKSSLLRILTGLLPAQAGEVLLGPDPVFADKNLWAHQFHYLGHLNAAKPGLSAHDQLLFFARAWGSSRDQVINALGRVGLSRQRRLPVRVLSQGQKRRLALARLFLSDRPIWFLDEPTAGLDVQGSALVDALLDDFCGRGGRALVISHSLLTRATGELAL